MPALLQIEDLRLSFTTGTETVRVLDGVSLSVSAGETVCLVGESGSGKTVTAMSIARLLPGSSTLFEGGRIILDGQNVLEMGKRELRAVRGGTVSYIFQEPGASLNPVTRVGEQIKESLRLHQPKLATDAEVIRLLSAVGIAAPETRVRSYPHEMSGGMQQRAMIAMAIATRPKLLVADEPTTALDVTIQAQILDLLRQLKNELGMALLLITHNLGVVNDIADRVAVMYAGQVVEEASASELLAGPRHPYTRGLLKSVPQLGQTQERLEGIGGAVPSPGAWPAGCRFHPRCPQRQPDCHETVPPLETISPKHSVRCPYHKLTPPVHDYAPAGR